MGVGRNYRHVHQTQPEKQITKSNTIQTTHMKLKSTLMTLSMVALASSSAWGQAEDLPVSRTAGILDISLPAGKTTLLSLPLVEIIASGTVSAVSGSNLTLISTPAGLPTVFTGPSTVTHAIKITSRDDQRGTGGSAPSGSSTNAYGLTAHITGQTGQVVTAVLSTAPNVGDEYVIYKLETLASVFGTTNQVGLLGSGTAANADTIGILQGGVFVKYFYKNTTPGGGQGWRLSGDGSTNRANVIIPANSGIFLERKVGTDRSLRVTGDTLPGNERLALTGTGFRVVNNPFVVPTTLGASFLSSFVTGAGTASGADYVYVENNGVITAYYYKNTVPGGGIGWRAVVGNGVSNSIALNPGKAILYEERVASFGITLPEPFAE
jgi:hypothetical protein